jgi:hypothetical protein
MLGFVKLITVSDPDPALFVSGFQYDNEKKVFLPTFFAYYLP